MKNSMQRMPGAKVPAIPIRLPKGGVRGWLAIGMERVCAMSCDSFCGYARIAVLSGLCLFAVTACDKKPEVAATPTGIEKKFERGPVSVLLKLDRNEVTIADRINLVIEVRHKEDYEVELPKVGEKLDQFGIVDYQTDQPRLAGTNEVIVRRSYVLEPFLSGEYAIQPFKVRFWKKGAAEGDKHELETEALSVKVKSLLPAKVAELKINDIAPPVNLPRSWKWMIRVGAAGIVFLFIGCGVYAMRRYRRGGIAPLAEVVPPHEIAYRLLEQLVAEDLVGKGQIKLFYQRISDIVRHYIENRFGLHAPEQTTDEFLTEISMGGALVADHKILLKVFLRHCDLVKFAEFNPSTDDIQNTFDSCKRFITETEDRELVVSSE